MDVLETKVLNLKKQRKRVKKGQ